MPERTTELSALARGLRYGWRGSAMSLSLHFNLASMRANLNLRTVDSLMSQSIQRMSSGVRINLAKDDPASMVLANGLRHHLSGINQALDNVESGVSMVQTAESGMDEVSTLLLRIRSLAVNAANEGTQDLPQLQALQAELDEAIKSISRIATDTQFGNIKLLSGNLADITLDAATKENYRSVTWDATRMPGGMKTDSAVTISPPNLASLARERVEVVFAGALPPLGSAPIQGQTQGATLLDSVAGKTMTVTGPTGSHTITLTATTSIDDVVAQINAFTSTMGARASYDSTTGTLAVESNNFGSGTLNIASQDMTTGASAEGLLDTDTTNTKLNPLQPARDTYRMNLQTALGGVPLSTDLVQGLVDPVSGTTLDATAGKTLTIYGRGTSATMTLATTSTLQNVVDWVNGQNTAMGTRATYDAATGELQVIGDGGPIRLAAGTMSTGGNSVGLLDRDTTTLQSTGSGILDTRVAFAGITLDAATQANYLSTTFDIARVPVGMRAGSAITLAPPSLANLAREQVQVVFAGPPLGSDPIQGQTQGATLLDDVAGKTLTITGAKGNLTISLTGTTTIDDVVTQINAVSPTLGARASYDGATGTLVVESNNFGSGTLNIASQDMTTGPSAEGLLDTDTTDPKVNPLQSPRDTYRMNLQTAAVGIPLATDTIQGLVDPASTTTLDAVAGKTMTMYGRGTSATMTMSATTTIQNVVDWVNGQSAALGTRATYDAVTGDLSVIGDGGPIRLTADTMSTGGNSVGLMDRDTTNLQSTGGGALDTRIISAANATIDMNFTDVGGTVHTVTLVQVPSSLAAPGNPAGGLTFTNLLPGPGINGSTISAWQPGAFTTTLADTTNGSIGSLLTTPVVAGNGTTSSSATNATIDMSFTDASGTVRTVTMVQVPGSSAATGNTAGGLTFTNLLPGPEMNGTTFSGWQTGAFTTTLVDTTKGTMGSLLTTPTVAGNGIRSSSVFIQSGGQTGQSVTVEIADMRAAALGHSANLGVSKGLWSLDDLRISQAFISGKAMDALMMIDATIAEVSQNRGRIGALQANALETASATLQVTSQNITSAESRLRDTDFAKESAIFARNQIIYQAATAMLAQANQIPQTILQMLKG